MKVFVIVRPYAIEFLQRLSAFYDIILFTASLREYADPVMDYIDPERVSRSRLFRESCKLIRGALVKDLREFDRPLKDIIIIDVYHLLNCRIMSSPSCSSPKMLSIYLTFMMIRMTLNS
jgi:TFIIF-interacting CTD phosphatase-like protein